MKYKNIILLGFRCVGKSYIGQRLAKKLNWHFIDLDVLIEQEVGKTIQNIVASENGWQKFRQIELDCLKKVIDREEVVIAAGGGVGVNDIVYEDNVTYGQLQKDVLLDGENTLKVLVSTDKDTIKQRLLEDRVENQDKRPSFNNPNEIIKAEEYIQENLNLLEKRKPLYLQLLDIVIENNKKNSLDLESLLRLI